ncbi:MAG: hypothetical protein QMB38_01405, partial [Ascidiaceihabitans sp.]
MTKHSPHRYFKPSPDIIRLAVMLYDFFPWSLSSLDAEVEQQRQWSNLHGLSLHSAHLTPVCHRCHSKGTAGA